MRIIQKGIIQKLQRNFPNPKKRVFLLMEQTSPDDIPRVASVHATQKSANDEARRLYNEAPEIVLWTEPHTLHGAEMQS